MQEHVKKVLKKVIPATVGISKGPSAGSGVIIDGEGHVLTAGHVSGEPNSSCKVILADGKVLKALSALHRRGQPARLEASARPSLARIFRIAILEGDSASGTATASASRSPSPIAASVRHDLQLSPASAVPSKFGSEKASRSDTTTGPCEIGQTANKFRSPDIA